MLPEHHAGTAIAGEHTDHKWFVRINNYHPARLNEYQGRHWSAGHRCKRLDRDVIAVHCLGAGVVRAEVKRRVGLEITLGPRQRGGDVDAYWKSVLDALVLCGAIVDDSKEWCELLPVTYVRGPRRATVISLEDVRRDRSQATTTDEG